MHQFESHFVTYLAVLSIPLHTKLSSFTPKTSIIEFYLLKSKICIRTSNTSPSIHVLEFATPKLQDVICRNPQRCLWSQSVLPSKWDWSPHWRCS